MNSLDFIPDVIKDQIVQAIAKAVWDRPGFAPIREPIEDLFQSGKFKHLTEQAFQKLRMPTKRRTSRNSLTRTVSECLLCSSISRSMSSVVQMPV